MSTQIDKGVCNICGDELDEEQAAGCCAACSPGRLPRRLTNQEFLVHMMTFSRFGPMTEVFIMEAVRLHAQAVAAQDPDKADQNSMVSPHLWANVARDIAARFEQRTLPVANRSRD
jgi:hypothetical protein